MSISPQPVHEKIFVSGACDAEAKVWDISSEKVSCPKSKASRMHSCSLRIPIALSNHATRILIRICGLVLLVGQSVRTFRGHESDINAASFFPDGCAFATGGRTLEASNRQTLTWKMARFSPSDGFELWTVGFYLVVDRISRFLFVPPSDLWSRLL